MLQHIVGALVGHHLLNTFSRHHHHHISEEIILAIGGVGIEVRLYGVQVLQRFGVDLLGAVYGVFQHHAIMFGVLADVVDKIFPHAGHDGLLRDDFNNSVVLIDKLPCVG